MKSNSVFFKKADNKGSSKEAGNEDTHQHGGVAQQHKF